MSHLVSLDTDLGVRVKFLTSIIFDNSVNVFDMAMTVWRRYQCQVFLLCTFTYLAF